MNTINISFVGNIQQNNQQKIICSAEIIDEKFKASAIGEGLNIDEASLNAKKNALIQMSYLKNNNKQNINSNTIIDKPSSVKNTNNYNSQDKNRFNGGGDKPASENQIKLIKDMVAEYGIDLEQIAARQGVSLKNNLTGENADKIIKEIKKEKNKKSIF